MGVDPRIVAKSGSLRLVDLGETGEPNDVTGERTHMGVVLGAGAPVVGPLPLDSILAHGNGTWEPASGELSPSDKERVLTKAILDEIQSTKETAE
jgi:hypothetical protein